MDEHKTEEESPDVSRRESYLCAVDDVSPKLDRKKSIECILDVTDTDQSSAPTDLPLLNGELYSYTASDVTMLDPFHGPIHGTLYITNYKIYFKASPPENSEPSEPLFSIEVPLGTIQRVEKIGRSRSRGENAYGLEICCKDMRTIKFAHKQEGHSRRGAYERLQIVAFPVSYGKHVFAYHFKEEYPTDGWLVYDAADELKRLGCDSPGVPWRVSNTNQTYDLCETYPATLGVLKKFSDTELEGVAQFRSKGRMPALSWLHPVTHASITRCSQPMIGKLSRRSKDDESYIQGILEANKNSKKLYILDARPKINAIANIAMGGGYEADDVYSNIELHFLDIGNIHVMRESLNKLMDIVYPTIDDNHWLTNLESTHWLDYIKCILNGAVRITELIEKQKASVLIHCTDGWDRTAQLSALSMLMLDPYYRTIVGFEVLIEKEWLSFGHKFQQRIGHGDRNAGDDQRAPIFLQFIDCVWQMTRQFPCAFEFNELFLITLMDHVYSCLFGTFLFNCERHRTVEAVKEKTVSLWSFTNSQIDIYKNPLYSDNQHQHVIYPVTSIRQLRLWNGFYIRWNPRMRPQESEMERNRQLHILIAQLRAKCEALSLHRDQSSTQQNNE
ncbi:myotubularin-related protein 2-like [Dysidea avara]|uniref:myotubularin-related protein 2-like n=1 Tax=Dysidea avara TaxID=196820 RepID=UPI0033299E7D